MRRDEERPRRGRAVVLALLTLFIAIVAIGVPTAIVAPVPRASAEVVSPDQTATSPAAPVFPDFGSSAIGVVGFDGVLATHGSQSPRPIASITKIVTALVVLEAKPVPSGQDGPTITFTQRDVDIIAAVQAANGTFEPVQAGWKASERDALATMLIPSANNYAASLADWAYGSVPKFLVAARAYLAAHRLDHTSLYDANGLDLRNTSTPTDLVALGKLALANPVIADIVKQPTATEANVGSLDNTNKLLGSNGVNGIKTGTYPTGANLLFSARRTVGTRTVQLVGVILGAKTHERLDATVPALLDSVVQGLHDVRLAKKGQAFATYDMRWGGTGRAIAVRDVSVLVWGRAKVTRDASVDSITGGAKGSRVGIVRFTVNSRPASVQLALDRDVLAAPVWWRLTHPLR